MPGALVSYEELGDDFATDKNALPLERLEEWLRDIRYQPAWRRDANIESDFYDGNQLDSTTLAIMQERGIAPLISNLIAPTIDVVLGMEAKSRTDWKVSPDDDEDTDVADAMNVKLHEAERLSLADRAISDAYASQVKVGIGWVEVARETNPFKSKYRVKSIHRRELWWDWMAKEPDLSDARYLVRRRWVDEDVAVAHFPMHKELIKHAVTGWNNWEFDLAEAGSTMLDRSLNRSYGNEHGSSIEEMDWVDMERRRVCLHEIWYRVVENGFYLRLPDGHTIEYDSKNPIHNELIAAGVVHPLPAVLTKMRLSWWIGPHRLADIPSPYPHNDFPYTPFFGKREDRSNAPYGLIRAMKSPQEALNARNSKMMWNLSAKRVIVEEDAVDDIKELAREVSRPDAVIELKKNRMNKRPDSLRIEDDKEINAQQFQAYLDDKQTLQQVAGVSEPMLGRQQDGTPRSGVAQNGLVEQSTTTLAEINDNYRYSRMKVGDQIMSLVKEDMGSAEHIVVVGRGTGKRRSIPLNQIVTNPDGSRYRTNNIQRTKMSVVLEDVPNTPSYRAQQRNDLVELTKGLPPEMQAAIAHIVVDSTDAPRKDEISEILMSMSGQTKPVEEMTPEELAAHQQQLEEQQIQAQHVAEMQAAELKKTQSEAEKIGAQTDLERRRAEKVAAETDRLELETDAVPTKQALDTAEQIKRLDEPPPEPGGPPAAGKPAAGKKKPTGKESK